MLLSWCPTALYEPLGLHCTCQSLVYSSATQCHCLGFVLVPLSSTTASVQMSGVLLLLWAPHNALFWAPHNALVIIYAYDSLHEDGHHHLGVLDAMLTDSIGEGGQGTWSPSYVGIPGIFPTCYINPFAVYNPDVILI